MKWEKSSAPLRIPKRIPLSKRRPSKEPAFGQSLLCFGVVVMKDSNSAGNAQEGLEWHSKYNLDFVD